MKVIVIAAHPDDEVLGCGGTMARAALAGDTVRPLIVGEGATARGDDLGAVDALRRAAALAAQRLGVEEPAMLGFPDNRLDTVPLLEIVQAIEEVTATFQPDLVYVQHGGDLNIDHAVVYRAALTAFRPVPGSAVRSVHAFPVASSTEWAFQSFAPAFVPQRFVDIGATLERKLDAMQAYESELRPAPHPRSLDGITATATHYGAMVGLDAAEVFHTVREIA